MSAADAVRLVNCSCGRPAEEHLTHYVVVRRDLPFGILLAQVTHAAGESFYKLADVAQRRGGTPKGAVERISIPGSSAKERASNGEAAGSSPAPGATFNPSETYAIVLGARNEGKLRKLLDSLVAADVPHVAVYEPDAPYSGALMAIGLCPAPKREVSRYVNEFHMLREPEPPKPS